MVAAPFALTNAAIWVAGYDISADANKVSLNLSADELDVTTFGSGGARARIGGLKDIEATVEGFQTDAAGAVGPELFPKLGTADEAWVVSPTGAAGSVAHGFRAGKFKISQFGEIGAALQGGRCPLALDRDSVCLREVGYFDLTGSNLAS